MFSRRRLFHRSPCGGVVRDRGPIGRERPEVERVAGPVHGGLADAVVVDHVVAVGALPGRASVMRER